jgi:hypothetical protein
MSALYVKPEGALLNMANSDFRVFKGLSVITLLCEDTSTYVYELDCWAYVGVFSTF